MGNELTATILVENSVNIAGLGAEHGLSLLIRSGGKKLLFDTGQSDLCLRNAGKMGLALEDLDAVVLSHGHYDHTGGLEAVCALAPQATIYAHPSVLLPKFKGNADGTAQPNGLAPGAADLLRRPGRKVVWTREPTEVLPGLFVTGEIPRTNSFETTGGRFFLDAGCTRPDPLLDDQALYFDTARGLVVLAGCAHAGVINTMSYIRSRMADRPFHAVIGGTHLGDAGPQRMTATIEAFRGWGLKHLVLGHCTGSAAFAQLWNALPGCCAACPVGTSLVFPR